MRSSNELRKILEPMITSKDWRRLFMEVNNSIKSFTGDEVNNMESYSMMNSRFRWVIDVILKDNPSLKEDIDHDYFKTVVANVVVKLPNNDVIKYIRLFNAHLGWDLRAIANSKHRPESIRTIDELSGFKSDFIGK